MTKYPVLLIGNFLSSSLGIRSVSEDLAEELSAAGWRVLTTSSRSGRIAKILDMLWTVWSRRSEYCLAHVEVYSGMAFIWAELSCLLLRSLGKPYLLTLHGGNLPVFARKWPNRVRNLLTHATAVVTPSTYLREQMAGHRSDLLLIPNPLHLEAYDFRPRSRMAPNIIWLRAFHKIYNPMLAPRVLAILLKEFPDATLTMIGPDKSDGSLEATRQVADRLGVESHLLITGKVPKSEIHLWLNRGDIFLNTTDIDNTPISILEAMACGLCVVSTNVGGLPYLLKDECDALLAPPDDAEALAAAIRRLLLQPDLAESISNAGRKKAISLDWHAALPQWEKLLAASLPKRITSIEDAGNNLPDETRPA